jgi:hypothetical protein
VTDLSSDSDKFLWVVRALRSWDPELQVLALYAANFWSEERISSENADGTAKPLRRIFPPKGHDRW